jgi:hypothetical protein
MGGAGAAGTMWSLSLSESIGAGCRSSMSTDVSARAGSSGSKSDSSELSRSSAVCGRSVVVCGAEKS